MIITINEQPPKFCKDCVYFNRSWHSPAFYSKCNRETEVNPVTGRVSVVLHYADLSRKEGHGCGPKAKFFKKKEKVLDKISQKCYTGIVERVVRWFKE